MVDVNQQTRLREQVEVVEKEIRETPYHKGTERHIGLLRARLARLKDKEIEEKVGKGGGGAGYAVKKQGDATVVLVGSPSVGKSTLLNKLTNAKSKVAPYAFTTVTVIPGMMEYKNARIQILDVPGLIKGAEEGKGRGREVLSVIRGCDLLLIMTDLSNLDSFKSITEALERNGIRINKTSPQVLIEKKPGGGIIIHSNIKQSFANDLVKEISEQFGIRNAEISLKEKLTIEELTDSFSRNRVYIEAKFVLNKIDLIDQSDKKLDAHFYGKNLVRISAEKNIGLSELKDSIWESLNFVNVFLVKPDEDPSFNSPIIMRRNDTLLDAAKKIGPDFAEGKTKAKIWGKGAKFSGQEVSLTTNVIEGMQVRFI